MLKLSLADQAFHRFGVISHSLDKVFHFAKTAGFAGLELTETISTRFVGPGRLRAMSRHYDLPITGVHQSLGRMVWSTLGSIERLLHRGRQMGARVAVVHLASVHRFESSVQYFAKVRQLEERYGLPVAFENAMAQFAFLKTHAFHHAHDPVRFRETLMKHHLSMTYDIGHMASLVPDPAVYYETVRDRVMNIHLQDYRSGFDHLPLGHGTLPLENFLRRLDATDYRGLITLEVFPLNRSPFLPLPAVEKLLHESLAFFRTHSTIDS